MKRCTKCGKRKPLSAFHSRGKLRPRRCQSECKVCWRARLSLRAELSRRLIRDYAARWNTKNQTLIDAADTFIERNSMRRFRLTTYQWLRHQAIQAYGGYRCACCGVSEASFLTIDHANNDGSRHRRRVGTASRFFQWLADRGYPPGFQVLCSNCNHGRYRNGGICPHQDPVGQEPGFLVLGQVRTRQCAPRRAAARSKSRTHKRKWSE